MAKPIAINVPHQLGKVEARRRIEEGFGNLERQMTGGLAGMISFQNRWEGDRLHFEGGALGQRIIGRLDVLTDSIHIEVDLPELLAALADRIRSALTKQTTLLLEKK
jgi:hypothetical protein